MHKLIYIIKILVIFLISANALSKTSSSYLIANTAMTLFDYEKANIHYNAEELNINNFDLERKLLAFVNSNSFDDAYKIAQEMLNRDQTNQESLLIYLAYSQKNDLIIAESFKSIIGENQSLNYIFNLNNKLIRDNKKIAENIFDIVSASAGNRFDQIKSYDYLLFYLSVCLYLNPVFDEANFFTAQIYQVIEKYEKAELYYSKVRKNHDLYIESQKSISINKKNVNKLTEAENDLLFLLKENPQDFNLIVSIGDFYRTINKYNNAIKYYSKSLNNKQISSEDKWKLFYKRGICYERINNWELAEEDFLQSLEIEPESPQVLNYLAYGWIERNIFLDKSLSMLEIAHEKYPESHYILDSLAWAHFKKKNLEIASRLMEEVIYREPGEAISLDHLGDIYFEMGRKREAFYMWKQAKDLAQPEDNIIESIIKKMNDYNAG